MSTLAFLADEHVNRAYVSALRSNGYRVRTVGEGYEAGRPDESLLSIAWSGGFIIITSDDDFVRLADDVDHAGIIMYRQQDHSAREFVRAIKRIDRYLGPAEFENHVEWLEGWL